MTDSDRTLIRRDDASDGPAQRRSWLPVVFAAVALALIAAAAGIYAASQHRPVNAHNVNDVPAPVPATAAA